MVFFKCFLFLEERGWGGGEGEGRVLSQLKEDYSDSGERLVTRMALWLNV